MPPAQSGWRHPLYAWRHNRWLFLAYSSVVVIVLLGLCLVGLQIYRLLNDGQATQNSEPDHETSETKPLATRQTDDDAFFAHQPLTILYYSFAQTTGSKAMYQATPTDQENRVLAIGYPDTYTFLTSPDGHWLLRWNEKTIERAAAATPQNFTSIYNLDAKEQKLTSVVWQADGAAIAISTTQIDRQAITNTYHNRIVILPLLTFQPITVYDAASDFSLELFTFPTATAMYYVKNYTGIRRDLSRYNPQSKAVEKQFTSFNQDNLLDALQFSADMHFAYKVTETQVIRYDLATLEQSVVYTTDRHCEVGEPNSNSIISASIAPSGDKLLVTESLTPCPRQSRNRTATPTPEPPIQQTKLYSLADRKVIRSVSNLGLSDFSSSSWSPNESQLWMAIDTQHAYIISIQTLQLSPIPSPDRYAFTRERVFLAGWLQP